MFPQLLVCSFSCCLGNCGEVPDPHVKIPDELGGLLGFLGAEVQDPVTQVVSDCSPVVFPGVKARRDCFLLEAGQGIGEVLEHRSNGISHQVDLEAMLRVVW